MSVLVLLAGALAGADHPRLLFGAADIPALQARITAEPHLSMFNHLVATWDSGEWGSGSQTPPSDYDEANNMVRAGFLYVLTGDDLWAQRARTLVENRINDTSKWANTGYKGLGLYMHGKGVALAYDFCYHAPSWVGFTSTVSMKLFQQAEVIRTNGGSGQNGSSASNWQGNRFSAGGLCYLACDETVPASSTTACFDKVKLYITSNMGTGATNRGWNIEGLGYTFYPWGNFIGPYGVAAKRLLAQDIRDASPAAVDHALWTTYAAACRIAGGGDVMGLRPDWGDDNPGNTYEGSAGLAFHYCPPAMQPGLVHWYERMCGALGDQQYDDARAGTIYSILFHPGTAVASQDPMQIPEWRAAFVDTEGNGYQTWRNRYQDADDLVAQVYAKLRGNAGHNGPDALGFRILGVDSVWAVGGGRYGPKINGQEAYWRSQNSLYPVDPDATLSTSGYSGALLGTPVSLPDGSGSAVLSIGTSNVGVKNHTRRFLADYSPATGAAGVFVISDTSDDGRWWQLCTLSANAIATSGNTFTITSPTGASMQGTVLHPSTPVFTTGTRIRGSGYSYHGVNYDENGFIHAQSADGDFLVVLSVVPAGGTHPTVSSVSGEGATSGRVLAIGGLTVAVNGDRIAAAAPIADQAPTVATPAAAASDPVSGSSVALSVLGADDGGEAALSYWWQAVGTVPAPVAFSPNGANSGKNTVATFTQDGVYELAARIADDHGSAVTSTVIVTVLRTPTGIQVTPVSASLPRSGSQLFAAALIDQFGVAVPEQPGFAWTVSGGGSIDAGSGLFTAGTTLGGPHTVTAVTAGYPAGTASVTVINLAPTVVNPATCTTAQPVLTKTATCTALGADDAGESALKYDWSVVTAPAGGTATFSPDNSNAAKSTTATFTGAGSYLLRVTIKDAQNASVLSDVPVQVQLALNSISVLPPGSSVVVGGQKSFTATGLDQFGVAYAEQPAMTWSLTGGGTILDGLMTAAAVTGGPYTVTATGGGKSGTVKVTVVATALPAPWNDRDVGGPTTTGNATFPGPGFSLKGAGSDIAGSADQFHVVHQSLTGDGELVARVTSVQNTNSQAKAGVMLRENLNGNARHVLLALTPGTGGARFVRRTTAGSSSSSTTASSIAAPYWVKVVRSGNAFSGWVSPDGVTWTQVGTTQTIAMATTIQAGLAVTSRSSNSLCTAGFDNVALTPAGGG